MTQLFNWKDIKFEQIDGVTYRVTAVCITLVDGSDPRDLSWEQLAEGFQFEKGDHAEVEWMAPLLVGPPTAGLEFNITVTVKIKTERSEGIFRSKMESIQFSLSELMSEMLDYGNNSGEGEKIIQFASLHGMCMAMRTQMELVMNILEEQVKK